MKHGPTEIRFPCRYGTVAGLRWNPGAPRKVLALHGWLDNAASFCELAPLLPDCDVLAMDFPGHGLSDHRAAGHIYAFFDYVLELPEVLDQLGWDDPVVLGHSLGAAIAQLFSVAQPERVGRLIMIENLGPIPPWQPGQAATQLRQAVRKWQAHSLEHRRFYATVEEAITARNQATPMPAELLRPLVERGLARTETKEGATRYHWRTDKRLRLPSLFRLAEAQIQEVLHATPVPTQVILAEPVTEALDYPSAAQRLKALSPEAVSRLPGCHHLHLTRAKDVAAEITGFLGRESGAA